MPLFRGGTPKFVLIGIIVVTTLFLLKLKNSIREKPLQGSVGYIPGGEQPTASSPVTIYDENVTGTEQYDITTAEDVTYAVTTRIPDFEPMYDGESSDRIWNPSNVKIKNPDEVDKPLLRKRLEKIFKIRKARLKKFCGKRLGWQWRESMQALAVPEKDLVVCAVQKAGSTAWHQLVHNIRNPGKEWGKGERMDNWNYAWRLEPEERRKLMTSEKVIRVITARHPFARLVSAWNNKFEKSYFAEKGDEFVDSMPGLDDYIGRHTTDANHTIAFEDLVQYIADVGLENVNVHLKSVELLCSPCDFPYDYVIKAETAPEYSWYVTEKIDTALPDFTRHAPEMDEFSPYKSYSLTQARHEEEKRIISRLFRKVPRDTIRVLMALYAADFEAFGYTFNASTLEAGGYS